MNTSEKDAMVRRFRPATGQLVHELGLVASFALNVDPSNEPLCEVWREGQEGTKQAYPLSRYPPGDAGIAMFVADIRADFPKQ